MSKKIDRRKFVMAGVGAGLVGSSLSAKGQAPAVLRSGVKPVVIASANGHKHKNGGPVTCVEKAFAMMTSGGADVLDALIAGVNLNELDPADNSVGYGGLPNADGVVQLDASVMHGPKKRAGAVACLEGVRTPSLVAKAVMEQTDHHLIVGKGAQDFARSLGFKIEEDLNSEGSRKLWLEWKRRTDPLHYLDPAKRAEGFRREFHNMMREGLIDPAHAYGTINCNGINAKGELCGVTTTSGLSWKIPGRVGDSPILGAGLYVDQSVGAAGSTGRGEANLYGLNSFLVVEEMHRGRAPKDACMEALKRIKTNTIEKRLLTRAGNPNFNINFYAINTKGEFAAASMYEQEGKSFPSFAICTENGPQIVRSEPLLKGDLFKEL